MTKGKSTIQEVCPNIDMDYLPEWKDDSLPTANTNMTRFEDRQPAFDANQIEDDEFDRMEDVPVYDYLERVIGYKSVIKNKKRDGKNEVRSSRGKDKL